MTRAGKARFGKSEAKWGYILCLPFFFGLALIYTCFALSFGMSFTTWGLIGNYSFTGFDNFVELFTKDFIFYKSLVNTIKYVAMYVPVILVSSLFMAYILNRKMAMIRGIRAIFFFPYTCSLVSMAFMWKSVFGSNGLFNSIILGLGGERVGWLAESVYTMPAIVTIDAWRGLGYTAMLFIAGMQNIPQTYYEAAEIDGCGPLRQFVSITMPLLSGTTFFVIITTIIYSFQIFETPLLLWPADNGPGNNAVMAVIYIYRTAFVSMRFGYGVAYALIITILILMITQIQLKLQKRWVHYDLS